MSWWDREIRIWHIPKDPQSLDGTSNGEQIQKLVSRMHIQVRDVPESLLLQLTAPSL
jgi:hypothetical protein